MVAGGYLFVAALLNSRVRELASAGSRTLFILIATCYALAMEITTNSAVETKKVASDFGRKLVGASSKTARVVGLVGELGAGKTTFAQGFAQALGIKEKIQSPTFVLMKIYPVARGNVQHFVHIDCYRIDDPDELVHLGFADILKDKDAMVVIEWAERVKGLLPKDTIWITLLHGQKESERILKL